MLEVVFDLVRAALKERTMAKSAHVDTFARDNLPAPDLWPDLIFTRPEYQYPERLNCVFNFLDRWIEEDAGDAPCIFTAEKNYSYRELQALVNRIANVLVDKLGLVPGGRVMLRSANNPMMVATYLAVMKAGGIAVATMPLLRAKEIAYPIQKTKIALALCDHKLADEMEKAKAVAPELKRVVYWESNGPDSLEALIADASPEFTAVDTAADDLCLIAFTSGTTGDPKGTMHFHRDMLAVCDGFAGNVLRARPEDPFHRVGAAGLHLRFWRRCCSRCTSARRSFSRRRNPPRRPISLLQSSVSRQRSASPRRRPIVSSSGSRTSTICRRCANACRRARRCLKHLRCLAQGHRHQADRRHRLDGDAAHLHQRHRRTKSAWRHRASRCRVMKPRLSTTRAMTWRRERSDGSPCEARPAAAISPTSGSADTSSTAGT